MSLDEIEELAAALSRMGLTPAGTAFAATRLGGGVSCDVWKVERPGPGPDGPNQTKLPALVVKRALAKLRVAADWRAPPERWATEVAWLKLAAAIDPTAAPPVLGEDPKGRMFAMAFLPDCPVWKSELAAGRIDAGFAAIVGHKLATIHASTANNDAIARQFDHGEQFHALRLEPYLLFTAGRHPDVADMIDDIVDDIANARIALMQGDISPKNILVAEEGPVFLDAETACYGDPVFDLSFCLNHLLLKCVWNPEHRDAYLESFAALKQAYFARIDWEAPEDLEVRAAQLLAALLLARIDGKSPVEYLTTEADKALVRDRAKTFLTSGEDSLEEMAQAF